MPKKPPKPRKPGTPAITILGLGQMGLVCANILGAPDPARAGPTPSITMWGHDEDEAGHLLQTRKSRLLRHFPAPC